MPLVNSSFVLQALSNFTGATVNPFSEETKDSNELCVYNILQSTFVGKQTLPGAVPLKCFCSELFVDIDKFLDPRFDYDYTDLKDDSTCMRGNEPYNRPFGWKRIAIKVLDKYPDGNAWLGTDGWRSYSVDGEWPISYHGTSMNSAKAIIGSHYIPGSGQRYGRGIYSTFDINEAAAYSHKVTCEKTGMTYEVLLQNRINPKMRKVCAKKEYWLIDIPAGIPPAKEREIVEKSIRPYGILFKEVLNNPSSCLLY